MNNIIIRQYREEDVLGFYEAVAESKADIAKWLPWCHDEYSIEDSKSWITEMVPEIWRSKKGAEFVIVDSDNHKIIGGCCLEQIDVLKREANIGYWVRTSETKKGIATFACHFLIEFGFHRLQLEKIKIIPSIENTASRKVAEKLPYESVELVTDGFQIREHISDALVYTVSRNSF